MRTIGRFRSFQLAALGLVAIVLAPLVVLFSLLHGFAFPQSISETGTMANTVASLLPVALGALALFSLTYALKHSYTYIWDKIFPIGMFVGFLLVAFFPCASPYVTQARVGIIPVSPDISHIIHCIGALVGFGAMILWIFICFTKSDKSKEEQTKQKQQRNIIYKVMGGCVAVCLLFFMLLIAGQLRPSFPIVYMLEAVMLCGSGLCCMIKSGRFLKDREQPGNKETSIDLNNLINTVDEVIGGI